MSTGIGMTMAITITCSRERRTPPTTATGTNTKQRPIIIHTGLTLIIDTIIMKIEEGIEHRAWGIE
jgi:hypothetical protein